MAMSGRELIRSLVELFARAMALRISRGERRKVTCREIFFAQLDEVYALGGPAGRLAKERSLLLKLVARIQGAAWLWRSGAWCSKCMLRKPKGRGVHAGVVVSQ